MSNEKLKYYLYDLITLLKEQAKEAKLKADNPKEGNNSFNNGYLMAYHTIISLMKTQALAFKVDEKEIGLADIDPEQDLL